MTDEPTPSASSPTPAGSPTPVDDVVVTHHQVAGLAYTVTAGRLVLHEEQREDETFGGSKPTALVNVISYVLDGDHAPGDRPVTFCFNGGPGSSSVWLHLGVLGPRRVQMGDAGSLTPPPYALVDNAETLLAHSDLVFIDPVSTGYSRVVEGGKKAEYHGFARDIDAITEVIRLWTSRHQRWLSPKLLAGESYGTTRAAALADALHQRHGLTVNGVILISSVLNLGSVFFSEGNDLPYWTYVPTYAALAHFHGRRGRTSLAKVVAEAREFATGDYLLALAKGRSLPARERAAVARTLARITGVSEDFVLRCELRIEHQRFFAELLRDEGKVIGRLDGRFTGWQADAALELADDPSYDAILGPYATTFNHYVRAELGYRSDLPYEVISRHVQPWSYKDFENAHVTVTDRLGHAMRANPRLLVHVAQGYHDGATPFLAAEHTLASLPIPPELRANIELVYYEAGHMMYVHEASRRQQSRDLARFVRRACRR